MADISKITLPNGTTYDIKDATARAQIAELEQFTDFLGTTTTELTDGATTNPITIDGESVTAKKGNIVLYGNKEFIFSGAKWSAFGDLSALGTLAYKNSVSVTTKATGTVSKPTFTGSSSSVTITATNNTSGNYQPSGTVSKPTFTGSEMTSEGTFTPSGSISVSTATTENKTATVSKASSGATTYTPEGTVSAPTFTGTAMTSTGRFTPGGSVALSNTNQTATVSKASSGTATYTPEGSCTGGAVSLNTTTVNSITAVGSMPTYTVASGSETLVITAGTPPTKGANTTVATGVKTFTQPTFTGTGARLVTGNISVPSSATFTGTEGEVSVSGTPSGSLSAPSFSGTAVRLVTGNIAVPKTYSGTFTGEAGTVNVSGTTAGSVSQPTFTGTKVQLAGTTTASGSVSQPTFTGDNVSGTVTYSPS